MPDWNHIIEREIIHFFAAPGVVLIAFHGVDFAVKKLRPAWYPQFVSMYWARLVLPAFIALFFIFLREPYDAQVLGAWYGKSYFDVVTWAAGLGVGIWGVHRAVWKLHG